MIKLLVLVIYNHEAMICTEMGGGGGGGDHITKQGTHISRDMGPGGGPYISNDMGLPGPMSLGKWGQGGPFHYYIYSSELYLKLT